MKSFSLISLFWPSHQLLPRTTKYVFHFCCFMPESYHSTEQTGKLLHMFTSQSRNQACFLQVQIESCRETFNFHILEKYPVFLRMQLSLQYECPQRKIFLYSIITFCHSTCFPIPCTYFLQCYLLCLLGDSFVMALVKQIKGEAGNKSLQFTGFKNDQLYFSYHTFYVWGFFWKQLSESPE